MKKLHQQERLLLRVREKRRSLLRSSHFRNIDLIRLL
jgi:hypothetical protein